MARSVPAPAQKDVEALGVASGGGIEFNVIPERLSKSRQLLRVDSLPPFPETLPQIGDGVRLAEPGEERPRSHVTLHACVRHARHVEIRPTASFDAPAECVERRVSVAHARRTSGASADRVSPTCRMTSYR